MNSRNQRRKLRTELDKVFPATGGYSAADLARYGVHFPPAKGWRLRLIQGLDPNDVNATKYPAVKA